MANKPVLGIATCPHCKYNNHVIWNGNVKCKCQLCGKLFKTKRQKLKKTQLLK